MKAVTFIGNEQSEMAGKFVAVGISVFLAKVAVTSGTQLPQVIAAGPALTTHSIAREPNVGLVASKYGLDSPEDRGVMITYITVRLSGRFLWG